MFRPLTTPGPEQSATDPGRRLAVAPVNRALFAMSAPISLGMLSTFLFQVVDTWFVGRLGTAELAALSFSSALFFLLVGLFIGLSVGASSLVARALGEGDASRAARFARTSVVLAAGLAALLSLIGLLTIGPVFGLLGADAAILPLIAEYMGVLYLGMPLLAVALVGNAAVRATGRVRAPEVLMGAAGVINLVLDYLLIFGAGPFPRLEIQGARARHRHLMGVRGRLDGSAARTGGSAPAAADGGRVPPKRRPAPDPAVLRAHGGYPGAHPANRRIRHFPWPRSPGPRSLRRWGSRRGSNFWDSWGYRA